MRTSETRIGWIAMNDDHTTLSASGIHQDLREIRELGQYVTCFLAVTDGIDNWDTAEVFLSNDDNRVAEIWAL